MQWWKFWQKKDNYVKNLKIDLKKAYNLAASIYMANEYQGYVNHSLRLESLSTLGAIALQHGGTIIIKPEFLEMVQDMQVNISTGEDGSTVISTSEIKEENDKE